MFYGCWTGCAGFYGWNIQGGTLNHPVFPWSPGWWALCDAHALHPFLQDVPWPDLISHQGTLNSLPLKFYYRPDELDKRIDVLWTPPSQATHYVLPRKFGAQPKSRSGTLQGVVCCLPAVLLCQPKIPGSDPPDWCFKLAPSTSCCWCLEARGILSSTILFLWWPLH